MNSNEIVSFSDEIAYWQKENVIGATTDLDIIKMWLEYAASKSNHTFKSYLKEVKRFLIYCDSVGVPFYKVTANEINEYLSILENPDENWLIPKNGEATRTTQILEKGLHINSVEYSQRVLKSLYRYMVKAGVIGINPVELSRKINPVTTNNLSSKSLSFDAWDYLVFWLNKQVEIAETEHKKSKAIRDKWLMNLMYYSGVRRSSLIGLKMDCFKVQQSGSHRKWVMEFMVKGNRPHSVFLTDQLLNELRFYRKSIGLSEYPTGKESSIPIVSAVSMKKDSIQNAEKTLSDRGVNYVIESCLGSAAQDCQDYFISEELEKATPHTFRHTCATHWLTLGVDVVATQKHLGHKNINTTLIYMRDTNEHRINEIDKLSDMLSRREK